MPDVEAKQRDPIRIRAKELTGKALENYIQGRLGLVVDSTGRDYDSIARPVMLLKQMGYDCYMIFVNTSLDVAMARNAERDRTVPPEILKKNWNTVQRNIGKFQRLFGQQKMIIVDNNKADENIIMNVYKQVAKFVKKPIESHIAKQWMRKEAEKKKKMKTLKELLRSKVGRKQPVVFAFGRLNPPTIGHQKLIDKVITMAKRVKGLPVLYVSASQDKNKNPLTAKQKTRLFEENIPSWYTINARYR